MKKLIITSLLVLAAGVSSFAQGTVVVNNVNASYLIYTNNSSYSSSMNGVYDTTGGKVSGTGTSYYYALLTDPTLGLSSSLASSGSSWLVALQGVGTYAGVAGGIKGTATTGSATASSSWGTPAGSTLASGQDVNYLLVCWTASVGTTWAQVLSELENGWTSTGFFGVSQLGNGYAGGGPDNIVAPSIFGTGSNAGGLTQGVTMYSVGAVPEPTTVALAGLGIAGLFALRRKK